MTRREEKRRLEQIGRPVDEGEARRQGNTIARRSGAAQNGAKPS